MTTTYSPTQRILVVGAGELGTAMLEGLVRHPKHPSPPSSSSSSQSLITVLLRPSTIHSQDPAKQSANAYLRSLGAALAPGDIVHDSEEALAEAFGAYDTVLVCAGFGLPGGTQLRIARAALRARVGRFFPWQWGIDYDVVGAGSAQDLFDEQLEVRRLLRAQREVDWVIVSTGLFVSFIFVPEFGPVDFKTRTLRALGSWDTRLSVTTPRDIGRVAAEIVYEPREINRQVVFAAGDTVSYEDVAALVEKRFGGQWKRELWDMQTLGQRLKDSPDDGMVKYQNVFGAGKGVAWDMSSTVNAQRGMQMQTVEDYLREMKD
ncbi:NAD(P)-binding protein [Xylariaceae sp. FL1651]|nr:NAD(P)-binding protein [Xylariaceae sp. FL1651]